MEDPQNSQVVPTIKAQLIARFVTARQAVAKSSGRHWKLQLAGVDPYFNTKPGVDDMNLTAQSINEKRRGQVDRIKRVVLALEKLAGIPHAPIL